MVDRVCLPDIQVLLMAAEGVLQRKSSTIFRVPDIDSYPYIVGTGG